MRDAPANLGGERAGAGASTPRRNDKHQPSHLREINDRLRAAGNQDVYSALKRGSREGQRPAGNTWVPSIFTPSSAAGSRPRSSRIVGATWVVVTGVPTTVP